MIEFLKNTVEYQNFGWNVITLGALGTVVFTGLQTWGFAKQNRAIWDNRSGESISVLVVGFLIAYSCAFFIYGIEMKKIAILLGNMIIIPLIPTFIALCKYKNIKQYEWVLLAASFFAIPAMIWFPKDSVLSALFIVAYIFFLQQGYEVWKNGPGVLELRFIWATLISGACWLLFAWKTDHWPIVIFNIAVAPIWFYVLYRRYKTPP